MNIIEEIRSEFQRGLSGKPAWAELAERAGLKFSRKAIEGTYRGRWLKLDTYTEYTESGEYAFRDDYTRIRMCVNAQDGTKLSLSTRSIFRRILDLFVPRDFLVGDERFDQRFVIKSRPKELATRVFASPELRQRLLQTRSLRFRLADGKLRWSTGGVVKNVDYLHSLFDLLCDVAEAVERAGK